MTRPETEFEVKTELHSLEPQATDAVDITLGLLCRGSHLKRETDGKILVDKEGCATIVTTHPSYVIFACERQRYVKRIAH